MKDPAFLFYSNDFYGATRTMLPEERACYIDLMIYQHQKGYIPTELKRVLLFCSGIDEATLQAVLQAKFKLCDKGWYNERLKNEMETRKEFAKNRSINGTVGQFWKRTKAYFSNQKDYQKYRKSFSEVTSEQLYNIINIQSIKDLPNPEAMLQAMLKHIEDEDGIENEDIIDNNIVYSKEETVSLKINDEFENFRKVYPGVKRGYQTEYKNLLRHGDWRSVILGLMPALEKEIRWREQNIASGEFCPQWPHLRTWINQRRWEQELNEQQTKTAPAKQTHGDRNYDESF